QLIISKLRALRFISRRSSRTRESVTSTRRTHALCCAHGFYSVSRKSRSARRLSRHRHLHRMWWHGCSRAAPAAVFRTRKSGPVLTVASSRSRSRRSGGDHLVQARQPSTSNFSSNGVTNSRRGADETTELLAVLFSIILPGNKAPN